MIKVLELDLAEDIGPLCAFLRARGVALRVVESEGRQQLWVADPELSQAVLDAYARYRQDPGLRNHLAEYQARQVPQRAAPGILQQARQFPMVLGLLVSLLLAGLYTGFGHALGVRAFVMVDFFDFTPDQLTGGLWPELIQTLRAGEWWRLISPAWLHWGLIHFLFNALGLWIFGRSLEIVLRPAGLFSLVIASALISNLAQFAVSGPSFGGFSGVVYALIGAHLVGRRLRPDLPLWMPSALIGFALFGLLVGLSGLTELGGVSFANAAHLGGFLSGLVIMFLAIIGRVGLFKTS
jgi:GlpG protein